VENQKSISTKFWKFKGSNGTSIKREKDTTYTTRTKNPSKLNKQMCGLTDKSGREHQVAADAGFTDDHDEVSKM
jgi:hypothetical protein